MFSTISILTVFIEIFLAGVALAGAYTFIKRHFRETRDMNDLYLGMLTLSMGLFAMGSVSAQLMFNIGSSDDFLLSIEKVISLMSILVSMSAGLVFCARSFPRTKAFDATFMAVACLLGLMVLILPLGVVFHFYGIEPRVESKAVMPSRIFWMVSWALLGAGYILPGDKKKQPASRSLDQFKCAGALMMVLSYMVYISYAGTGSAFLLLAFWALAFFGFSIFVLANAVPESEPGISPLDFLRTRVLFKLVIFYVLMIVLIVEATTLVTIAIARNSLSRSVVEADRQIAISFAEKIEVSQRGTAVASTVLSKLQLESERMAMERGRMVYVVDAGGRLLVHPDIKRAISHEFVGGEQIVHAAMKAPSGGGEFRNRSNEISVGAFEPVAFGGWHVIVEEPITQAYSEIRKVETNSMLFVILGIILAVMVGLIFAKSIEGPINELILGTVAVRAGDLDYRIQANSTDEIGKLANEFNHMINELKETQSHLIASEKLAALGTMAAGMAHEIKNPLVALRTFTQLFPMKWQDEEFRNKFSMIVPVEIDKINRIAESLLKFGRPSKPEFKKIELNTVIEEVMELMENQFKKNNIRVATKMIKTPPIDGDASQLAQAFLNIILNAVQAMPNGGELIVKTDTGHVIQLGNITQEGFVPNEKIISEGHKMPTIFVEITDTGDGIPEDKMKNLFDPVYTTKPSGSGMGLPITLRIIEEHKGSIKVRSQVGKGTTFLIILPQAEQS